MLAVERVAAIRDFFIRTVNSCGGFFSFLLRGLPKLNQNIPPLGQRIRVFLNAMEAGDIRKTDAPEQAYRVGKSL